LTETYVIKQLRITQKDDVTQIRKQFVYPVTYPAPVTLERNSFSRKIFIGYFYRARKIPNYSSLLCYGETPKSQSDKTSSF